MMGCGSQNLHMTFIIIFMLITFHCTLILVMGASLNALGYFNVHDLYSTEVSGVGKENHVEKVSGEDQNEVKEALILEKFRVLLGLQNPNQRSPLNGDFQCEPPSPSPSPSPTIDAEDESPAPSPVLPIHFHSHHPSPRPPPVTPHQNVHKEGTHKGRVRRAVVAVLVSAGATFVMCAIGLICFCHRFRKQRKRSASTVPTCSTEGGIRGRSKYVSSQATTTKVSSDSGLDLFYLDSLGTALEPQPFCLKQNSSTVNISPNHYTSSCSLQLLEREESDQELLRNAESDNNGSCSAAEEIESIHCIAESIKYDSDGSNSSCGDKIIPVDAHSSDDESFQSFCDSHSSNVRLSNASAGSLSDTSEITSTNVSKTPCSATTPLNLAVSLPTVDSNSTSASNLVSHPPNVSCNLKQNITASPYSSNCQNGFIPPPPPPPPPCVRISPSRSSSYSTQITVKALSPSTLLNSSSPRNSDSSSGSNQTPKAHLLPSPPKPPVGIPPPPAPCPPPFLKGNSTSLKGPPPPPSLLPKYTPLGKDGAPLPKLKPLHWDKVRAAPNRSMVWDKLKSSSFELDEEMIETLFGYKLQNSMKNDEGKSKSPSPSKHVLDSKRLQNITILSKALNATAEQVCSALIQGNGLCLQQLEALVKMVPTKEEEAQLSSYKGDINQLGSAEKFVKAMLNIPFAFLRIEAMLYRETFEDEVVHLRKSFSMLEEACKELRSSRLFLKLLETVLKTGNRMNVGTIRGGARAFKLDTLLKLADVKGTDGKTTLLHFVVQEIVRSEGIRVSESLMGRINNKSKIKNAEEREEDYRRMGLDLVSGLSTELCNVKKTATIDLDVLASSVSNLSDGMAKLQHLVCEELCVDEKSENFVQSMKSFLGNAEMKLKELQEDEDRVLIHVREIAEYFHGDVSKDEANPLRIFVIVRDFLGMLDHVCKELRSFQVPNSISPLAPFR